jgi:hypothetical protein
MKNYLDKSMTYSAYRRRVTELLENNKTSGTNHSEAMLHYTKMNERRMNRLDKKPAILPEIHSEISKIDDKVILLTLTEAWCGDAAQVIPVIERMIDKNSNLNTRYIWRDEHTELIDRYLTDGGRGIPKILFVNPENLEVFGSWGPRPEAAQNLVREYKANPTIPYSEFAEKLHSWYAKDKTISIQKEFSAALSQAIKKLPSELGS